MARGRIAVEQGGAAVLGVVTGNGRRRGGQGVVDVDRGYPGDWYVNRREHVGSSVRHEDDGGHVHGRNDEDIFDTDCGDEAAIRSPQSRVKGISFVSLSRGFGGGGLRALRLRPEGVVCAYGSQGGREGSKNGEAGGCKPAVPI